MKNPLLAALSLMLALIVYANYNAHWSLEAQQGYRNQEKLKLVKLGMTMADVKSIMGTPTYINQIESIPQSVQYSYLMPPGSSEHCDVNFDASGKVIDAHCTAN